MGCGTSSQNDRQNQNNAFEPQAPNQKMENAQPKPKQQNQNNSQQNNGNSNTTQQKQQQQDAKNEQKSSNNSNNKATKENSSAPVSQVNCKFYPTEKFNPKAITSCILQKEPFTKYEQVKERNGDKSFIDIDFIAKMESVTSDLRLLKGADKLVWKRVKDIFDFERLRVFQKKIEPNDIHQGNLGNCYFLSALSAMAERPNLIEKLFITKLKNDQGLYCVILCIDGEFREVIVDDQFPCDDKTGKPAFSKSNEADVQEYGDELWVLILEKAYAKCFGTYQQIMAGTTGNAIRDLSGAPYVQLKCEDGADKIWNFIHEHDDKGHILTAGTKGKQGDIKTTTGLVSAHAYAILDHKTVQRDGEERIIQLRNPWGNYEWKGDWSDKSTKWNDKLKEECCWVDADDGIFWIEVRDFIKEFGEVTANQLVEDYLYTSQRLKLDRSPMALVTFHVKYDDTHTHLSVSQKDERYFKIGQYFYSSLRMMIVKSDFSEYIGSAISSTRDLSFECTLKRGTYHAFIEVDWSRNKGDADSITFSSYSSDQIQIEEDYQQIREDQTEIIDKMLTIVPLDSKDKIKKYDIAPDVSRYVNTACGYFYFVFENNSSQSVLSEIVSMMDIKNLKICEPYKLSGLFTLTVEPGQKKLVKYKITSPNGQDFNYKVGYSGGIELNDEQLIEEIKEKGTGDKKRRGDYNVFYYPYHYQKGFGLLHWNQEQNGVYDEELELRLNNLCLKGEEDNSLPTIKIKLQPGECVLHRLNIVDRTKEFSFKSSLWYELK